MARPPATGGTNASKWGIPNVSPEDAPPGQRTGGPAVLERYQQFARAIRAKYSDIKLVGGVGPDPEGEHFSFAWDKLRALRTDIVDEHSHRQPDWFFHAATRFDKYDRSGPKVMVGERAAHSESGLINPNNRSNWQTALSEAAYMTGLERNADLVVMSCYAPTLAHADAWQWKPDLIWFDSLRVYGTPSYYVQKIFSENRGTSCCRWK